MNFLGHAYISRDHPHLIPGNFAGDSYKGRIEKFAHLPKDVVDGVRLHRFIDDFTDTSPNIIKVGRIFQDGGVQKVGFIASDILLDHYLSREWSHYSQRAYSDFVHFVYTETDQQLQELHSEFQWMYGLLKKYGWLFDYPTIPGISKILSQFSKRIGFENDLLLTVDIYQNRQNDIDSLFHDFLEEINEAKTEFLVDKLGQKA